MLKSMTGCVSHEKKIGSLNWTFEIRSLNHRFLDFSVKLPSDFSSEEQKVRDLVRSVLARGKVTMTISCAGSEEVEKPVLNKEVIETYISAASQLSKDYSIEGQLSVDEILRLPKALSFSQTRSLSKKELNSFYQELEAVLKKLVKAKEVEGRIIWKDMQSRLATISDSVKRVEKKIESRKQKYFEQLQARVKKLFEDASRDDERLWKEVALLAERTDISEELSRLTSHVKLFEESVKKKKGKEVGRELDFICQELHREINTLGSKAQMFEIAKEVILVKGEIEKIREQVQNVE